MYLPALGHEARDWRYKERPAPMKFYHNARLLIVFCVIMAEPFLPNGLMIIFIAAATILAIRMTQFQYRIGEQRAIQDALCAMKREIMTAVAPKSSEQ